MARGGINKAQVQHARDSLLARGLKATVEAVRVELGNTGSKSTILRYIQELTAAEPRPPAIHLNDELQTLIGSLAERLAQEAQEAVAADRARLQREQDGYHRQREIDHARNEQLQKSHDILFRERNEGLARERELAERILYLESERQRLLSAEQHQERLLEDRAIQISSLEEKHRHARETLAHYRQQHIDQREQEIDRYETELQMLKHEARQSQERLLTKHEELQLLYRELETRLAEGNNQTKIIREKEQLLERAELRMHELHTELSTERANVQQLKIEHSDLLGRARHHLLEHRQDRRDIRVQSRLIAQLQEQLLP
ncbi:DNA-binding protein [Pseudomonas xanthosomatis]|uniref:DNA-binding protein n=1 Tax=Pseudomonas xanthosomatis TaxID=2842356 RepID=UPI0035157B7D